MPGSVLVTSGDARRFTAIDNVTPTTSVTEDTPFGDMFTDLNTDPDPEAELWYQFWAGNEDGTEGAFADTDFGKGWVASADLTTELFSAPAEGESTELWMRSWTAADGAGDWEHWTVSYGEGGGETGETFELTTETDTITGTADDETITGVSSALSSARTLNAADEIDGGDGEDTLTVDMQGNFTGFTGDGGLSNVEIVDLTNDGSIARTFNATGVEGVEEYVLQNGNAATNLADLIDAGAEITVNDQEDGNLAIAFDTDSDVVTGTADALSVNLNSVGIADDPDTDADDQPMVPVSVTEATRAALDLPLAFTRKPDGTLALMALLSLEKDNNVHVGPKGLWMGGYMPAVVRAHPFALAYQKDKAVVVVDSDSDWLSRTEGQPLFDAAGSPTKLLDSITALLKQSFPNPAIDTPVLAAIDAAGILDPWTAVSDNLFKINPEKLAALPGEDFLALRQKSALALLYAQLMSMLRINRIKNLAKRKENMAQRQMQQGSGDIDYSLIDDDILNFNQ